MDALPLTKELYIDVASWLDSKGYSINTKTKYLQYLKLFSQNYHVLNRDTLRKILKKYKQPNQKAVIQLLNTYCLENNIDFNIFIPRTKRKLPPIPEVLSPNEVELMVRSAPYPYDLCIRCIFNMGAGLRISEIIKFSWNHIRWIDWLKNQEGYGVAIIKTGKGSKDRLVNIPKNLMKDLYKYAKEKNVLNEFRIPTGSSIFDFGSSKFEEGYKPDLLIQDKETWKHEYVKSRYNWFRYNIIQKYCEKAINKKIKVHNLRHSRATYLYQIEKMPLENIQFLLGHSSINTTMLYVRMDTKGVFDKLMNTKEI